ncbi:DNA-binding response regulator [Altererythrobacter sp. B11]|nr:DNA-binding response regulator [Altererythrobacter sp. B11]
MRKQCGEVRLVFLTQDLDVDYMIEAFGHGAHGFILNDVGCESLLNSLHLVALGEKFLPGKLVDSLPQMSSGGSLMMKGGVGDSPLSDREAEILNCLVVGLPNKLIARRLDLCEATVKVHVKGILRKLGVQNRTQAAIFALNNGLDRTFRVSGDECAVAGDEADAPTPQMA